MKLFQKTILASTLAVLFPVGVFAQTEEIISNDYQKNMISYWAQNNDASLRAQFDTPLLWSAYVMDVAEEAFTTNYSALFHAFTMDFINTYGFHPQQASIGYFRDYYAKRKNDFGGELLLPTMAIWYKRPYSSIVPIPDNVDAYWEKPEQAAETYDLMAAIDREDTIRFMGTYMGAYYGHPTKQKVLKNFWKKWLKRDDSSAAKQDIALLKRGMLAEIFSHDPEYAVYELASKEMDLWPQLAVDPVTLEEQSQVQNILSAVCLEDNPTQDCARFLNYANNYRYTNNLTKEIQTRLVYVYGGNPYYDVYWGFYGWHIDYRRFHRRLILAPYPYPWWYHPYPSRPHWRDPWLPGDHPTHHPGGPRPPRPGGHGGHGDNPGHNPGGNGGHPGGNGGNPGHNPGGNGGHPGGNGDNPGHNPGGNGGHPGGNGDNPGHNPGGNGGRPGGSHVNPGDNSRPSNFDTGNGIKPFPGKGSVSNGTRPSNNSVKPGNIRPSGNTGTRPSVTPNSSRPTTVTPSKSGSRPTIPSNTSRPTTVTPSNSGTRPSVGSHTSRPSGNTNSGSRPTVTTRSSGSFSGNSHSSTPRSSGNSMGGSRSSSSGHSFGGGSHSSGSSHGGSFGGSHGGGGRRR